VGEYITEQKMELLRFGEDAKPSRERNTNPCREGCHNKREGYETEQKMDLLRFGEDAKPSGRWMPQQAGGIRNRANV
jgi:hypothetical protein